MGDLFYRDARFIYTDGRKEKVMLDCTDLLANKSRISLHCLEGQDIRILPVVLSELIEKESADADGTGLIAAFLDILLADRLMRTSQPVRVLEYGCGGGRLSWHLAELVGTFCEESSLVCAGDRIDPLWQERIARAGALPRLSFLAGDYGMLQLQQGYFDVVFINGLADFADPGSVMEDARKLAAKGGLILGYCPDAPLLEDIFRLYFDRLEEYEAGSSMKLFRAKAEDFCWMPWEEAEDARGQAREHIRQAGELLLTENPDREAVRELLYALQKDVKKAAGMGDVELKLKVLEMKERMLEHLISDLIIRNRQ